MADATCAQTVPAQQLPGVAAQASPVAAHIGSPTGPVGMQTAAPGGPTHDPLQQSSGAMQAAPTGAHASAHA